MTETPERSSQTSEETVELTIWSLTNGERIHPSPLGQRNASHRVTRTPSVTTTKQEEAATTTTNPTPTLTTTMAPKPSKKARSASLKIIQLERGSSNDKSQKSRQFTKEELRTKIDDTRSSSRQTQLEVDQLQFEINVLKEHLRIAQKKAAMRRG
mmetsp:Transcript_37072/g.52372  ORF Transcript_37072/g.52372 Transcript_37072/m.52372 type:complete len:155 (-) Transcript_37072:643-1107(-)